MPFTLKPDEFEYVQYDGTNATDVSDWLTGHGYYPNHYGPAMVLEAPGQMIALFPLAVTNPEPIVIVPAGSYLVLRTSTATSDHYGLNGPKLFKVSDVSSFH